jgi:hypothetical protein
MIGTSRTVRLTGPFFVILLIGCGASAADNKPPAAKKVTSSGDAQPAAAWAKAIKEHTGIDVDVAGVDPKPVALDKGNHDFWVGLEKLAEKTNSRIVSSAGRLSLKPGKSHSSSAVSGPFRFSVREILIRGDAEAGTANYTVILDVTWEPWLSTYRIDTVPKVTSAKDDTGKNLTIATGGSRTFTTGHRAELTVRPQGITRAAKTLTLSGSILVTIADKLLTFTWDAASGKPIEPAVQEGVSVNLTKLGPDGNDWVATVQLRYPKSDVIWESHEYAWHRNNVMRLLPPKGQPIAADLVEAADFRYGFKGRANQVGAGWKLDYRTPGPMREIVVRFELKDIRLP